MSLLLLIMIIFSFVVSLRSVIRERKHKKAAKQQMKAKDEYTGEF